MILWKLIQSPDTWPVYLTIINKTQNIRNIRFFVTKATQEAIGHWASSQIYQKSIFFNTPLCWSFYWPSQSSLDDSIRTFSKKRCQQSYGLHYNSIHCLCYVYIILYIIIGIILIQHDNDNEKLDFVVTKSAVDSLVES